MTWTGSAGQLLGLQVAELAAEFDGVRRIGRNYPKLPNAPTYEGTIRERIAGLLGASWNAPIAPSAHRILELCDRDTERSAVHDAVHRGLVTKVDGA